MSHLTAKCIVGFVEFFIYFFFVVVVAVVIVGNWELVLKNVPCFWGVMGNIKALKSCSSEKEKSQREVMFENILNLTIELVHLANHRDLFMCLLTLNSRKFLIEIVNCFSRQNLENESIIRKYADLLNLLDTKEVFSYKTSSSSQSQLTAGTSSSQPPLQQATSSLPSAASASSLYSQTGQQQSTTSQLVSISTSSLHRNVAMSRENLDDPTWIFYKFKSSFYELVYKFPHANYLKVWLTWHIFFYKLFHINRKFNF